MILRDLVAPWGRVLIIKIIIRSLHSIVIMVIVLRDLLVPWGRVLIIINIINNIIINIIIIIITYH